MRALNGCFPEISVSPAEVGETTVKFVGVFGRYEHQQFDVFREAPSTVEGNHITADQQERMGSW